MASGSTNLSEPSNEIDDVNVDLPEPFGPAITVSAGTLSDRTRDRAQNPKMSSPRPAGLQVNF